MRTPPPAILALLLASCATFYEARTPAGGHCSDMPVLPDSDPASDKYHRIGPISSDPIVATLPEMEESLRRKACARGADAVIDITRHDIPGGWILNGTAATVQR